MPPSSSSLAAALLQGGGNRALWSGFRGPRRHQSFVGTITATRSSSRNLHATSRTTARPRSGSGSSSSGKRRSAAAGTSSSSGGDQQPRPQHWRRGGTGTSSTTGSSVRHGRAKHHNKQSSADPQQQQEPEFIWVPRAYRGWLPEGPPPSYGNTNFNNNNRTTSKRRSSKLHHHHHHHNYDATAASPSSSSFEERQERRERKRAARAAREKAEECLHLHSQLLQLAAVYRRHFQQAPAAAATTTTTTALDSMNNGGGGGALDAAGSAFTTKYSVSNSNSNSNLSASSSLPLLRRVDSVQQLQQQVRDALRNIHESDGAVRSVDASEHDFRALCSKLQALCTTACGATATATTTNAFPALPHNNNTDTTVQQQQKQQHEQGYADLAECCVRQLVLLGRDRALLADALKTYGHHQQIVDADGNTGAFDDGNNIGNKVDSADDETGVTGWFKKVIRGIFRPPRHLRNLESDDDAQDHGLYAHRDPNLQVPRRLFRSVLMSIAATVSEATVPHQQPQQLQQLQHQSQQPESQHNNDDLGLETEPRGETGYVALSQTQPWELKYYQPSPYEAAAERMTDLLDDMPADWTPDTDSLRIILDMVCRAGTLHGARTCHHLYDKHPSLQYGLQFAMVLEAYLQAAKKAATENDKKLQLLIAEEAVLVIRYQWDRNLPKHRVERIMQSSIVLNCLSIAVAGSATKNSNGNDDDKEDEEISRLFCDKANTLSKAALGGPTWATLLEEMETEAPKVDTQTLPVVNYLTQLYAPSGNKHLVETAKRMLHYMMHHGRDGVRFMVFPDAETCNAVLRALLERNDRKKKRAVSSSETDENDSASTTATSCLESDFDYAQRVVEYMHRRREVECWPNKETYQLLFGFLDKAQPDNVGALAEEWLSLMEAKQYLSRNSSLMVNANYEIVMAENAVSLSMYHRVLRYLLKEARRSGAVENDDNEESTISISRDSSSDSLPCVRALRLLDRLQIRSVPVILNDHSVRAQLSDLYELDLRPTRHTFLLILKICAQTHQDRERAAAMALEVYQRWVDQDKTPPGEGMTALLRKCASFLPESSETKQDIDACMQYLNEVVVPNDDLQTA